MTQLEAGAIDLVLAPPIRDVARLSKDPAVRRHLPRVQRWREPGLRAGEGWRGADDQQAVPPGAQRRHRSQALDRHGAAGLRHAEDAAAGATQSRATTARATRPSRSTSTRQSRCCSSPAWARRHSRSSGTRRSSDNATVMQIYQQDLAKIGLTLTLKPTEPVAFVDQTYNSKFPNLAASAPRCTAICGRASSPATSTTARSTTGAASAATGCAAHGRAAARDRRGEAEADLCRLDGLHPGRELGDAVVEYGAAVRAVGQSARRALEPGRLHDDQRRLAVGVMAAHAVLAALRWLVVIGGQPRWPRRVRASPQPAHPDAGTTRVQQRSAAFRRQPARRACWAICSGLDGHLTTGLDSLRRVWDVVNILDDKLEHGARAGRKSRPHARRAPDDPEAAQRHSVPHGARADQPRTWRGTSRV